MKRLIRRLSGREMNKRLIYEIADNEISLEILLKFFESKPDSFEKIWSYFEKRKYKDRFRNEMFKRFIESNIDFIEDKIFENVNNLYSNFNKIQIDLEIVMIKDKKKKYLM